MYVCCMYRKMFVRWKTKQKTNPQAFMACRAPSFLAIGMTNMTRIVLVSEFVLSTLIILICYSHQCRHVQLNMKDISQSVGSTEWTRNGRERQREVQGDCFLDHWGPCELLSKTQLTEIKPVTAYCSIQRHNCVQSAGERGTGRGAFGRLRRTREGGEPLLPATDLLFLSRCLCAVTRWLIQVFYSYLEAQSIQTKRGLCQSFWLGLHIPEPDGGQAFFGQRQSTYLSPALRRAAVRVCTSFHCRSMLTCIQNATDKKRYHIMHFKKFEIFFYIKNKKTV